MEVQSFISIFFLQKRVKLKRYILERQINLAFEQEILIFYEIDQK